MLVEAKITVPLDYDYFSAEVGELVIGNARSYKQNFITIEYYDDSKATEDNEWIGVTKTTRVPVEVGSIVRLYCGCGEIAVRYDCEPLCNECEYEAPEDHRLDTGYHAMDYMRDWDD